MHCGSDRCRDETCVCLCLGCNEAKYEEREQTRRAQVERSLTLQTSLRPMQAHWEQEFFKSVGPHTREGATQMFSALRLVLCSSSLEAARFCAWDGLEGAWRAAEQPYRDLEMYMTLVEEEPPQEPYEAALKAAAMARRTGQLEMAREMGLNEVVSAVEELLKKLEPSP